MSGHVYKRCTCPPQRGPDGRRLNCLRPHGSWTFVARLPEEPGTSRRQHTKGGFATKKDAEAALRAFLAIVDTGHVVLPSRMTVEEYLTGWLDAVAPSLAPTAASNYRIIVRCYVLPHLGAYKLTTLRPDHLIKAERRHLRPASMAAADRFFHHHFPVPTPLGSASRRHRVRTCVAHL